MKFIFPQYSFKHWTRRLTAACLDAVGILVTWPFKILRQRKPMTLHRLLVIRLDHLGDLVMTRPALAALYRQFPDAEIDLLLSAPYAGLFKNEPGIRQIISFHHNWFSGASWIEQCRQAARLAVRLRENHYDAAIDFRGDIRNILLAVFAGIPVRKGWGETGGGFLLDENPRPPRVHQVLLNLKLLEPLGIISNKPASSPFAYPALRRDQFFKSTSGQKLRTLPAPRILIHAGAGYPSKRWPLEKFILLAKQILQQNLGSIILIGTAEEKSLMRGFPDNARLFDLRGQTDLADLPILMDSCDLFIGNDSGPAHLAAAQNLDCVITFSGTNESELWRPWSEKVRLIENRVPCSPCESRECPLGHHQCLRDIQVDAVFQPVRQILDTKKSSHHAYDRN